MSILKRSSVDHYVVNIPYRTKIYDDTTLFSEASVSLFKGQKVVKQSHVAEEPVNFKITHFNVGPNILPSILLF